MGAYLFLFSPKDILLWKFLILWLWIINYYSISKWFPELPEYLYNTIQYFDTILQYNKSKVTASCQEATITASITHSCLYCFLLSIESLVLLLLPQSHIDVLLSLECRVFSRATSISIYLTRLPSCSL